MARILFAIQPLTGHVTPTLPIARRLVERGHEVCCYTGSRFRDAVEDTGTRLVPPCKAPDLDERGLAAHAPGVFEREGIPAARAAMQHFFVEPGPGQADDICSLLARWPADLLVVDPSVLGATVFAPGCMPPRVALGLFPLALRSRDTAPFPLGLLPGRSLAGRARDAILNRIVPDLPFAALQRRVNALRAKLSLPPLEQFFFEESYRCCDLFLQTTVPEFEYPRRDLPESVHFIGPITPEPATDYDEPTWWHELHGPGPVVAVTQGTFATDPRKLLLPTMRALADEDVLLVATSGEHTHVLARSGLPENVRIERFIPFERLLPHADLLVTNGGYGGVQAALRHGVPLVVAGRTEEKAETAARVRWSGVGIDLRTSRPRTNALRRAVRRVLTDPSYTARARSLGDEMSSYDAVAGATHHIERLLRATTVPEGTEACRRPRLPPDQEVAETEPPSASGFRGAG